MATTPNSATTTSKEIDKFLKEIRGCTDHISAYGDWDEIIPTCEHIIDTCNAMKNACQEAVTSHPVVVISNPFKADMQEPILIVQSVIEDIEDHLAILKSALVHMQSIEMTQVYEKASKPDRA